MRTDPRPTRETIGFYYPSDYKPHAGVAAGNKQGEALTPVQRMLGRFIDTKTEALPKMKPGRMLELGCASGVYLKKMRDQGWDVEGLEPSGEAAGRARELGFQVHETFLEDFRGPEKPVDLIVAWMVLEHLHDPVSCLKKMRSWLNPGGRLVFSVPDESSPGFDSFKGAWYNAQVPTHLYHYTPKTLGRLLAASGWWMEHHVRQRSLRTLFPSMANVMDDRGIRPETAKRLRKWANLSEGRLYPLAWLAGVTGWSGRMTVRAMPVERL